jgi:uncharacterized protein
MKKPSPIGVGIQYNPEILNWFPFEEQDVELFEILLDSIMGPLDSPYILKPGTKHLLDRLAQKCVLVGHSNYGCDFGFSSLEETAAVRRHISLSRLINSPWVVNHLFYGDNSWLNIWSSPIQFSNAELKRVASRARRLQELYGIPLAHENAAYYIPCPGSEMREAEFIAKLVEEADTFLHLDLHNIYTNSLNFEDFNVEDYLNTIPLERIISVHLAGGSWFEGIYHDWHDSKIPEPVWEMLEYVLGKVTPTAVVLEYQGQAHHPNTKILEDENDTNMILNDLARAKRLWNHYVSIKN